MFFYGSAASPLHSSQVNVPSLYNNKSDYSPHSSQYPDMCP